SPKQIEHTHLASARAPIVFVKLHTGVKGTGEHAIGQRPIGHDANLLCGTVWEDLRLHAPVEHVPAILHHIHPTQPHTGFELRQAEIGHANVARLALLDNGVESAHGFLEGRVDVRPMDQIHVDIVRLEVLQALLNRGHDALATAVATVGGLVVAYPEFGHNIDVLPALPKGPRQGLFGRAHTIGFRGVKAVDADIDGAPHRLMQLPGVDFAVGAAHFPAAKTDRRDLQASLPKWSIFHTLPLLAAHLCAISRTITVRP